MSLVSTPAMRARVARMGLPLAPTPRPAPRPPLQPAPSCPAAVLEKQRASPTPEIREWRERQSALYMRMRRLAPTLFAGRPVPMACGIYAELVQRLGLDDAQDLAALRVILRNAVARPAYQQALAAAGSMRHNLDGEAIEPVSDAHRARAQVTLETLKRKAGDARQSGR